MSKGKGGGRSPSKGKGKRQPKGKGKGDHDDTPSREDRSKHDPIGPCVVPSVWKDKEYDDIPIVQDARPAEHYVEAYLQGTSDIPTFRVVWITSMGTTSRSKVVSPNRFGDAKLWKTPDEDPGFWEPCRHDQEYITLSPGEDDCCRMCPNTDADELVPCAWCNSWAHYRCTYAVGPGRACASHFKILNPLDKIVVARDDDPIVPTTQRGKQVFPNCCHPRVDKSGKLVTGGNATDCIAGNTPKQSPNLGCKSSPLHVTQKLSQIFGSKKRGGGKESLVEWSSRSSASMTGEMQTPGSGTAPKITQGKTS